MNLAICSMFLTDAPLTLPSNVSSIIRVMVKVLMTLELECLCEYLTISKVLSYNKYDVRHQKMVMEMSKVTSFIYNHILVFFE